MMELDKEEISDAYRVQPIGIFIGIVQAYSILFFTCVYGM